MKKIILLIFGVIVVINAQGITNTLGGNTADDKFIVENSDSEPGLEVTGEGNVGIGVTNPEGTLHIHEYGDDSKQLILGSSNQPNLEWFFRVDNSANFSLNNEQLSTSPLYIGNTGNVGIGKSNPIELFTVKMGGTTWGSPHFALEAFGSNNKWDFIVGGSDKLYISYNETTPSLINIDTDGNVDVKYGELNSSSNTGEANLIPIAYGSIGGIPPVISADTGNCTVEWSTVGNDHYEITISGQNYADHDYVTVVTLRGNGLDRIVSTNGYDNELTIFIYDISSDDYVQNDFHFVTYKP